MGIWRAKTSAIQNAGLVCEAPEVLVYAVDIGPGSAVYRVDKY